MGLCFNRGGGRFALIGGSCPRSNRKRGCVSAAGPVRTPEIERRLFVIRLVRQTLEFAELEFLSKIHDYSGAVCQGLQVQSR
jgi:hypothetical protein